MGPTSQQLELRFVICVPKNNNFHLILVSTVCLVCNQFHLNPFGSHFNVNILCSGTRVLCGSY